MVDGSSYLFRAFHALPPLVSSRGQPTGAVKGVINMIRALLRAHQSSHIAIVFDAKGKTFRNEIYKEYKAHRPPMPDELRSQIQPIHEIIKAMGLPLLMIEGVEADDVIGTLARRASERGLKTLISTGDKDLAQLVDDHVTLINTMTNEALDQEGVLQKFGIGPELIVDYLALMGDKSDNIPGVPGVGPKTAVKWLQEHGSMTGIIANADSIGGKIGEKLRNNIDQLRLSYDLATIKKDVKVGVEIDALSKSEDNQQSLFDLYSQLEFKSWIRELEESGMSGTSSSFNASSSGEGAAPEVVVPDRIDYQTVLSAAELAELAQALQSKGRFAISIEALPGHFLEQAVFGMAFATEPGKSYYVPIRHEYVGCPEQLSLDELLLALKPLLENPLIIKVGYDLKHMKHIFQNHGVDLQPLKSDVLLASYVLNSVAIKHALADISRYYLDLNPKSIDEFLGKGRGKLTPVEVDLADYAAYAAEKADLSLRLADFLEQSMTQHGQLLGLYRHYELALIEPLQRLERNGILIDSEVLERQSADLAQGLEKLQAEAFSLAGEEFNLGSPKQLQAIFFDKLDLPVLKKTPTGQPSTAEPVLQELAESYELPRLILEHRSLHKLKSTYTDKLPLEVSPETGRIHSSFQQAVAATGRLSSTDPNLQNIPIRTAAGRQVRQAFIAPPGYRLMAADYSQVELRIMAHLSGDQNLLTAFRSDADIHKATAAEVFDTPLSEVSSEQRRSAKAINFGLIYGMSAFGLANQLNVGRGEAQRYVDQYFERYPGVRKFMDETQALADEKGYVETLFGRRLYLPDIHAGNAMLRRAAQRTAINAPMQGTAADIIKQAMIDIDHWLDLGEIDARMLLQVHDELVFEVSENDAQILADGVRFRMVTAAALDVPLIVDVGFGANWDQAH